MAHLHCSKQQFGRQQERTLVSVLRLGQRPLCMAAMALAFSLQAGPVQASLSQTANSQASFHNAILAMDASTENHGFATEPMAGRLTAKDADGQINIRKQPSVRSPILTQGDNQDPLYIFKSALTPQGERWYFVENIPTGEQGWVHGDYVLLNEPGKRFPSISNKAMEIEPTSMTVKWNTPHQVEERPEWGSLMARDTGAWVNVRSQTNTDSAILHQGQRGEPVYIYRSALYSSPAGRVQVTQLWHYVALLDSGIEGWVHGDYVASAWESDEPFDVGWRSPRSGQLVAPGGDDAVPLREYVSRESPVLRELKAGESVTLLRKLATARGVIAGIWYEVELADGTKGWVHGPNVREVV